MSTYHDGQFTPGRGLSPNAVELGRQIALARQLLQKQKQAEFRANAFFQKRSTMRPAAHILPMKKDDYRSEKSDTYLALEDDDLDDEVSFHKVGSQSNRSLRSGFSTSRTSRNVKDDRLDSTRKSGDELLEKWKVQGEMRKLEGKLHEKTREVAELQTQVDHTLRIAQDKERNISSMKAVWDETAARQSIARQRLRHYVDDLADRAEKAENEVEDLKTSLSMSRTASLSRVSEGSKGLSRYATVNPHHAQDTNTSTYLSPDIMQHQYSSKDHRGVPKNPLDREEMYAYNGRKHTAKARMEDPILPSTKYTHVETPIHASHVQLASHVPHLPTSSHDSSTIAPQKTPSPPMLQGMSSNNLLMKAPHGTSSASLLPGTSSYLPVAPSFHDRFAAFKDQSNWNDLDFLEGVMDDVMKRRAEEERNGLHDNPRPSPTAVSRGFSPLPSYGVDYSHNSPGMYRGSSARVENDDSESEVSVTSVSQWSEEGQIQHRKGTFLHHFAPKKRRAILLLVFSYLSTSTRLKCATVCREWRDTSRRPDLWRYVHLRNRHISSKFLETISLWCTQLKWLTLEKLSPRKQREDETQNMYVKKIRGCLEPGLEVLLQSAGSDLLTLKIVDCPHILTERVLWLASCHCRSLMSVTYISRTDPVGPEVIWALGAGCRHIQSLKIPPKHPCEKPKRFNNACVAMIGRCWTQLKALSVGGSHVHADSLTLVVRSCAKLQVLELDHMTKITEEKAVELCRHGLRGLHTLILKHTPITPSAIIHFNGACPQLTRISVHLSLSDFFPSPASPGQRKEFSRAIETLLVLSKRRSLENTLQVRADYK